MNTVTRNRTEHIELHSGEITLVARQRKVSGERHVLMLNIQLSGSVFVYIKESHSLTSGIASHTINIFNLRNFGKAESSISWSPGSCAIKTFPRNLVMLKTLLLV